MSWLRQAFAVSALSIKSIRERRGSSLVAVVGIAGVVAIATAVLSIAEGFRATMTSTGSPDTVLVMRAGTDTEMNSVILRPDVDVIADAPGVLRKDAQPLTSAELFVTVDLPKRSTGTTANVPLRGVEPAAFDIRDNLKIVAGRRFTPGTREMIVGAGAERIFGGIELGSHQTWEGNEWTVVGIFTTGGTVADSEIWCDSRVLQPAYHRGNSYQAVYAKLTSPAAFDSFKDALTADPRLSVKVVRERDYYSEQSTNLTSLVRALGGVVALIMGAAAAFGAFITLYNAVAARTREIATLRALGFRAMPVVLSVLAEALALAAVGGVVGGALAYLVANGHQTSTINWQSFSQVTFAFAVTPELLVRGVIYALVIGFVGGLVPAIRAARLPVAAALREL
jgi:putative ABC transport system permease protein